MEGFPVIRSLCDLPFTCSVSITSAYLVPLDPKVACQRDKVHLSRATGEIVWWNWPPGNSRHKLPIAWACLALQFLRRRANGRPSGRATPSESRCLSFRTSLNSISLLH